MEYKASTQERKTKLFLLADDMILSIENPKEFTKTCYSKDPISKFSKVTGYMIKTQKSAEFLDNSNEQSERKLKKQSCLQ